MFHIALKMLIGDRSKYVMLIGGLTFAALLMTQQSAVFFGLLMWTTSHLRNMRAEIWVVDPKVEQVNELKAMRDTDVSRVRSVTGVARSSNRNSVTATSSRSCSSASMARRSWDALRN